MNSNDLLSQVIKIYNFPLTTTLTPLRESSDNHVFIIKQQKKKYILRISQKEKEDNIEFETELMNKLNEESFPIPQIIRTAENKNYDFLDNNQICLVTEFIEGIQIELSPTNKLTLQVIKLVAEQLAHLHAITSKVTMSHLSQRTIFYELEKILTIKDTVIKNYDNGDTFIHQVEEMLKWGEKQKLDEIIIHNDYRHHNLIFSHDLKKLKAVIDYDWSCQGPAIKDLAHAICEWSFPDGAESQSQDIFDCFLTTYNENSTFKFSDLEYLKKWIAFSCLSDAATYFYDRITANTLNKSTLTSYMYKKYSFYSY